MNVPSSATGITSVGMIVARKFCRKTSITINTRPMASASVRTTSAIDAVMNGVVSYGTLQVTPVGRSLARLAICAFTAPATERAFAPGSRKTARPPAGLPLKTDRSPYVCAPNVMRATSPSLTTVPLLLASRTMSSNCLRVENSASPETVAVHTCPLTAGSEPREPAANCAFCEFTALRTCVVESP